MRVFQADVEPLPQVVAVRYIYDPTRCIAV